MESDRLLRGGAAKSGAYGGASPISPEPSDLPALVDVAVIHGEGPPSSRSPATDTRARAHSLPPGTMLPRAFSMRVPTPFRIPSKGCVSVSEIDDKNVYFKYLDFRHGRKSLARLFKRGEGEDSDSDGDGDGGASADGRARAAYKDKTKMALLVLVGVLVDGFRPIAMVWAKDGNERYPFAFATWVLLVKLLVLVFSIGMYLAAAEEPPAAGGAQKPQSVAHRARLSLQYLVVPATLYTVSDVINLVVLQYISASSFSVLKQSRLVMVSILFRFWLGRYVGTLQWVAVAQLVLASLLFEASALEAVLGGGGGGGGPDADAATDGDGDTDGAGFEEYGVMLVLLKCFLDSLAIVWMDVFFKKLAGQGFPYAQQQVVFAIVGFVLSAGLTVQQVGLSALFSQSPFTGWTAGAWVAALLAALYGVLVSLVLRYLDSMVKMMQSLLAIVLTIILDQHVFGEPVGAVRTIAIGFVLTSVLLYKLGTVKKAPEHVKKSPA